MEWLRKKKVKKIFFDFRWENFFLENGGNFTKKGRKKNFATKKISSKIPQKSFNSILIILRKVLEKISLKTICLFFFFQKFFPPPKKFLSPFFWFKKKKDLFDFESISSFFPLPETIRDKFVIRNNEKENRLFIYSFLRFFSKTGEILRELYEIWVKGFFFSIFFKCFF